MTLLARPGYRLAGLLLTLWSNLFRQPGFRLIGRVVSALRRRSAGIISRLTGSNRGSDISS